MPKREDIKKVLIIGSGPIIIGQACEFDYSGTQACKALRQLGYQIVLVNSNPATIMTDPSTADVTYIEPLNVKRLTEIIAKERPCALLPNLGGQSGLNLSLELDKAGVLDKYGVKVIGVQLDAIERGEDRIEFKKAMDELGIEMARSAAALTVEEAEQIANDLGYPVVVRPAYTMGGTGGGLVYNQEELRTIASRGIEASMIGQILIEESVLGWEELELEVVRDSKNQMITVCFIENVDAIGVHTGDSYCTAPMLTISESLQQRLKKQAYAVVESIGVIGGTNVQFAHDPVSDRIVIIEINPRTSRSSALASKATGFPIALVSAMLASGITLDEIPYFRDGSLEKYTPSGDYVVVKFARWAFDKFKNSQDKLGTQMRAVGEVMSIGKTYKEAFQKAIRSLEIGRHGLGFAKDFNEKTKEELLSMLVVPTSERQFILYEALRKGATIDELHKLTAIKKWFIQQMQELIDTEKQFLQHKMNISDDVFIQAKKDGFADRYLAFLCDVTEGKIRARRLALGVTEEWEMVPVSAVEGNEGYFFSTYNTADKNRTKSVTNGKKVMVLGGGPNRIGQGIEFDYCCVHAAFALREMGFETIMVNCNPETVSTDYDTSDRLYFEPLTVEDVLSIYEKEKPLGIIAQFGGQTPLNIAKELEEAGCRILGTSTDSIDLAEDRDRFNEVMHRLQIPMPESGMAVTVDDAITIARRIGFPLMVRPSYVLGGRGMEVVYDEQDLTKYMSAAIGVTPDRPILIDRFLNNAKEVEADAIADGKNAFVPAVMEHVELAGVHSGDSACIIPSCHIAQHHLDTIYKYTEGIAKELKVFGLMNMQYAIEGDTVYVLEANPRASRTVPLVSKVCNISMAKIATRVIMSEFTGQTDEVTKLERKKISHFGVKESVFPFNMMPEVDPVLGPEMRSTGEVLGISNVCEEAFYKAQEGTGMIIPPSGTVFISVSDKDKAEVVPIAKKFADLGFDIIATDGTHDLLCQNGITSRVVKKLYQGRPNVGDEMTNGKVQLIINTPASKQSANDDSYIRKTAIKKRILCITTLAAANMTADALLAYNGSADKYNVKSLQSYHSEIK